MVGSSEKKEKAIRTKEKNYGAMAFFPLLVFLGLYVGGGILFSIMGLEKPFGQIPREIALLFGIAVAFFMSKRSLIVTQESFSKACGDPGVMLMILIFALAGAFSGVAKAMGGVDSTVNMGLTFIPSQFIVPGIFVIAAFVATAMGTSMGVIAAIGPIAVGVAESADLNLAIAMSAVVGGALFGDNLSIISDTTIAATRGMGCKMRDKFKMNFLIALPAAIAAIIVYAFIGGSAGALEGPFPFEIVKVLPYIAVLVFAILGVDVLIVLMGGTLLAGAIGIATSSMTFITFCQAAAGGIGGMMAIIVTTIFMRGISGLIRDMGGIDWLTTLFNRNTKSRKGAQLSIAGLVSVFDACLGNNTIAILIAAPLSKPLAKEYKIAPERVASLLDIFACIVQGMIPHGGQIMLAVTLTSLSPLVLIKHSYYLYFLAAAMIITIVFDLLRTKEEKEGAEFYPELDVVSETQSAAVENNIQ